MNRVLEQPVAKRVVTIGPSGADFTRPQWKCANLAAIRAGRLGVHPWHAGPGRVLGEAIAAAGCHTAGRGLLRQLVWHNLAEEDWDDFIAHLDFRLPCLPIWVTLDKDVLPPDEAVINWARLGRFGELLVHGLGGTPVEMKTFGCRLFDVGATVLCCQLAGHCGTEEDLKATSWRDWYASVEAALARLEESCDTIVVGGLPMGALLAARLAREQPDRVHGLVMLASTFRYDGWSIPWYSFLLKLLMPFPFGRRYRLVEREPYGVKDERIRALVLRAMSSDDPTGAGLLATSSQALREMWRLAAEMRSTLDRIRPPVFLAHARQDDVASLGNAFLVQRALGGVEMLVLEDSYHLVTVDLQRGLVGRRAAEFVRGLVDERALDALLWLSRTWRRLRMSGCRPCCAATASMPSAACR